MASVQEFTKNIRLKFDADEASYRAIERDLDSLGKMKLFSKEDVSAIEKQLKERQALKNELSELQDALKTISVLSGESIESKQKELRAQIAELKAKLGEEEKPDKPDRSAEIKKWALDKLKGILESFSEKFKQLLSDSWAELQNILDFLHMSNQNTRDLMMGYGFSSSEAYGWSKAMSALGFSSEEDLMYANANELKLFREAFTKYSDKYTQLYDSGTFETMENFNAEMAEFKEDLKLEVVQFFMDNKDVIKTAMNSLIELAEFTIKALGTIVKWLNPNIATSDSQRAANTAAIISNYSNINRGTNIRIDNTFNNVGKADQPWLANAGQLTYEQVIRAIQ